MRKPRAFPKELDTLWGSNEALAQHQGLGLHAVSFHRGVTSVHFWGWRPEYAQTQLKRHNCVRLGANWESRASVDTVLGGLQDFS